MKPFNLERALAGDSVITRDGRKIINIAHFSNMIEPNLIWHIQGDIGVNFSHANGKSYDDGTNSSLDLFMAPVKKKLFIKVRKTIDGWDKRHETSMAYETVDELPSFNSEYQTVEIEIEI
jgi:hypothetical protein